MNSIKKRKFTLKTKIQNHFFMLSCRRCSLSYRHGNPSNIANIYDDNEEITRGVPVGQLLREF